MRPASFFWKLFTSTYFQQWKNDAVDHLNSHSTVLNLLVFLQIERIQNKILYQQYEAKLKLLENQNSTGCINERILWHGTANETVPCINTYGFNRSYCGKHGIHNYNNNLVLIRSSNLWTIYLLALGARAGLRFWSNFKWTRLFELVITFWNKYPPALLKKQWMYVLTKQVSNWDMIKFKPGLL